MLYHADNVQIATHLNFEAENTHTTTLDTCKEIEV